jgi:hypothetical protein
MDNNSRPGAQNFEVSDAYPELNFSPAPNTSLRSHFLEYVRLVILFARLHCENRRIAAQNFLLSCRLQLWQVAFVYFRIQIFCIRLAHGFPVSQCWPRK